MASIASEQLLDAAHGVIDDCGYKSAVLAGIVPDQRHKNNGGYHCSINDLIAYGNQDDYSNTDAADKGWNPKYSAAIDVALNKTDMVTVHGRVRTVWADKIDPRRKYVNAINCWDGSGDAVRYDFDRGTSGYASPDHKTHTHAEVHRRYVRDPKAARALVSIYQGESKAAWIAREEGDDMPSAKEVAKEVWDFDLEDPQHPGKFKNASAYQRYADVIAVGISDRIINALGPKLDKLTEAVNALAAKSGS